MMRYDIKDWDDLCALVGQQETEITNLRWSLLHAMAERDDALWTLERVNGRAQEPIDGITADAARWEALRDIRSMCKKALTK